MLLLHRPDGDDKAAADPEDAGELLEGAHPTLGGREVVDHGDRQHRVEALVPEGQRQVVARQDL